MNGDWYDPNCPTCRDVEAGTADKCRGPHPTDPEPRPTDAMWERHFMDAFLRVGAALPAGWTFRGVYMSRVIQPPWSAEADDPESNYALGRGQSMVMALNDLEQKLAER